MPPEGSLLPETFVVQRGCERQAILDNMTARIQAAGGAGCGRSARRTCRSSRGRRPSSWPRSSRRRPGATTSASAWPPCSINRLRQNMRLQSDPTILYGMQGGKVGLGPADPAERDRPEDQRTTPTRSTACRRRPICNPGRRAIEAVLNPADTKELYFVADGTGGHVFSETLKDHNANVSKWRAREGDQGREGREGQGRRRPLADPPGTLPYTNAPASSRSDPHAAPPRSSRAKRPPEKAPDKPAEKAPEKAREARRVKAPRRRREAEDAGPAKKPRPRKCCPGRRRTKPRMSGACRDPCRGRGFLLAP